MPCYYNSSKQYNITDNKTSSNESFSHLKGFSYNWLKRCKLNQSRRRKEQVTSETAAMSKLCEGISLLMVLRTHDHNIERLFYYRKQYKVNSNENMDSFESWIPWLQVYTAGCKLRVGVLYSRTALLIHMFAVRKRSKGMRGELSTSGGVTNR